MAVVPSPRPLMARGQLIDFGGESGENRCGFVEASLLTDDRFRDDGDVGLHLLDCTVGRCSR